MTIPNSFKIIVDTREQHAWTFPAGQAVEIAALASGDYSIAGLTELVSIERKELSDLISCITSDRQRFKKELQRLKSYRCRAVVIESTLQDILEHRYRSAAEPESVMGSIASWQIRYDIAFIFAGNHEAGARYCYAMLRNFYRQCEEFSKVFQTNVLK